jgi:hypothetical protein
MRRAAMSQFIGARQQDKNKNNRTRNGCGILSGLYRLALLSGITLLETSGKNNPPPIAPLPRSKQRGFFMGFDII